MGSLDPMILLRLTKEQLEKLNNGQTVIIDGGAIDLQIMPPKEEGQ
jgi:hypothetical protein